MRVFIAINLHDSLKVELMSTITNLKEHSIKGNFTRRENLHLTLAFIGEIATNQLSQLIDTMDKVAFDPFTLKLQDLDWFQNREEALYYRSVSCPEEMLSYRQRLIEAIKLAQFWVDEKEFIPHITLGRRYVMKESLCGIDLSQQCKSMSMQVEEISLMKSEHINGMLTYTKIYGKKAMCRE